MMTGPGLFDLQVNGYAGIDFNAGVLAPDEIDRALEAMLRSGVTACLPTIITAHPDELESRFAALDRAISRSRLGPAMCPGYHLEGPFLNPAHGYAGCHPPAAMTAPDEALIERIEAKADRPILMVTVAPEVEGVLALIRFLVGRGKLVALGHTAASVDDVARAAEAGARLSTHLGNGLPQLLPKFLNPLFAQLAEDRLVASFIADGVHIPPHALKALIRAKTMSRSILVTDAVTAAAAPPGRYRFAGMTIEGREDGSVRQAAAESGGALAGSALRLDQAVRNIVAWGIADAPEALAMASTRPRDLMAPALKAHGITLPQSEVQWSDDLVARQVRLGDVTIPCDPVAAPG